MTPTVTPSLSPTLSPTLVPTFAPTPAPLSCLEEGKLNSLDPADGDRFGYAVAVSGDTAIVGAYRDDDAGTSSGSAYIFVREAGAWSQQAKLTASDDFQSDLFGYAVSVSGDTAIVGAYGDDDFGAHSGSAYIFVREDDDTWSEQWKLTADDAASGDWFGHSVSISGDTVIVGAYQESGGTGSAYIFVRDNNTWSQEAKLIASDAGSLDLFGFSVSVSGDTAIVSSHGDDDRGDSSGSAYVFVRENSTWSEESKLNAEDGAAIDFFGYSVSVSGDTAIVGAYANADYGSNTGSAYIFERADDDTWSQQVKLTSSDIAGGDLFGWSVSVSGDMAVVGAHGNDDAGGSSGSAYIFERVDGAWSEAWKLTASDAGPSNVYGHSVSVSGDTAVVGAYQNFHRGFSVGSAYAYSCT
jgi:sarcosine oxidase delta subunit